MSNECFAGVKDNFQKNKKIVKGLVVAVVLMAVLSVGAHAIFRVQGVVTSIDNNNVTVANFFWSRTVDLSGTPFSTAGISPGDRIMIQKNLQGNVLYVASPLNNPRHGLPFKVGSGIYHESRR